MLEFTWDCLQDMLPSRESVFQGVIAYSIKIVCPLCGVFVESISHLFVLCELALLESYRIFHWLSLKVVIPSDHKRLFDFFPISRWYG